MNSDEVKHEVDEKYPQFLMSWKHFLEIQEQGSVDKWAHHRQRTEDKDFEEAEKRRMKGMREKGKKCAIGSMEFGESGHILSFTSYAVKGRKSDIGFCGFLVKSMKVCCAHCLIGMCCCCRKEETEDVKRSRTESKGTPKSMKMV